MSLHEHDLIYRITEVRGAERYNAQRRAVLTGAFRSTGWTREGNKSIIASMNSLRRLWQKRLADLKAAAWGPLAKESHHCFMRNCPPFGVLTHKITSKPCKRTRVCPFCYARQTVLEMFLFFERELYGGTDPASRVARLEGRQLVEFHVDRACDLRPFPGEARGPKILDYGRRLRVRVLNEHRQDELRLCGAKTGAVLYRLEPFTSKLRLVRSGILLTSQAVPDYFGTKYGPNDKIIKYDRVDKHLLAEVVGRVCRYPRQMLIAPAEDVVALLRGLQNARLLSFYGGTPKPQKPVLEEADDGEEEGTEEV